MRRTTEDYLKTIYLLGQKCAGVHAVSIAEALGVTRPTVSITIRRLETDEYVTKNAEHEIYLTEKGKQIARATLERHNTFEKLLTKLGVDKKTAATDACRMEHAVSPESYEALKRLVEKVRGNGYNE